MSCTLVDSRASAGCNLSGHIYFIHNITQLQLNCVYSVLMYKM